jgi:predicted nuclease of predicted toxin-antitoxin system
MTQRIRFYLDEHVPFAVARALQRQGVDVLTVGDTGRIGLEDIEQLRFATDHGRVMVTMDSDYIAMAAQGTSHAGIAYARPGGRSIGELVQALMLIYHALDPDDMKDHVEYL